MVAMAASPTPKTTITKAHNHPPYKEMIASAIGSLKERKGSSKTAIAKYIESNYNDLPPSHNALLSHHLRRLKKKGFLEMVVKSYKLTDSGKALHYSKEKGGPTSRSLNLLNPVGIPKKRGRPPKKLTSSTDLLPAIEKKRGRPRKIPALQGTGPSSEKRKPGRPRKRLSTAELILPRNMKFMIDVKKRKPGRPEKGSSLFKAEPAVAMTLGKKRQPGRPKKDSSALKPKVAAVLTLGEKRKRGRPKQLATAVEPGQKRKQGRPKQLAIALEPGEKRKRGRPKKLAVVLASGEKRKPGRPKKVSSPFKPKFASVLALGVKREPGRQKKGSSTPKLATNTASVDKRKPGRPKKSSSPFKPNTTMLALGEKRKVGRPGKGSATPKLAASLTSGEKRKRGRPKKVSAAIGNGGENGVMVPSSQNTVGEVPVAVDNGSNNLPAIPLAPNTEGGVSAASEDAGGILPEKTSSLPERTVAEEAVEGSLMAVTPLAVDTSGEKRKRGRPKKGLTPSILSAVSDGGNGLPDPVSPATSKEHGGLPKKSISDMTEN